MIDPSKWRLLALVAETLSTLLVTILEYKQKGELEDEEVDEEEKE